MRHKCPLCESEKMHFAGIKYVCKECGRVGSIYDFVGVKDDDTFPNEKLERCSGERSSAGKKEGC